MPLPLDSSPLLVPSSSSFRGDRLGFGFGVTLGELACSIRVLGGAFGFLWIGILLLKGMESASSVAPAESGAAQGAGGDGDDSGVGPVPYALGLANEAADFFKAGRYQECVAALNQLLQKKPGDVKVRHNIAIVEYYRDGCTDPRKLLEVLNESRKSQDHVKDSGEELEVAETVGSSYSGNDIAVATFNYAVLLYHLGEYAYALSVLEPLFRKIEGFDAITARNISFLLLDVALASQDAPKAYDVMLYLDNAFGASNMAIQADNGSTTPDTSKLDKTFSEPSPLPVSDASDADSSSNLNLDNQLTRTSSDDNLDYEALLSSLDIGRPNVARVPCLAQSEQLSPAIEFKVKLHLYKIRLLLLVRNLKAAKHELKLAVNVARARDLSAALLLKSQLECARGNYRKATKLLNTAVNRTEEGLSSVFFNNIGYIQHQLKKHHTSILLFSKAVKECSFVRSKKPLKLSDFSQDKSLFLLYNCGLEYLTCGKPVVAARCFQRVSSVFYNQPLFWVRLAECCLMAAERGDNKSRRVAASDAVRLNVVGTEKWRHIVVKQNKPTMVDSFSTHGSLGEECLSLSYARKCLLNAQHLLNIYETSFASMPTLGGGSLKFKNAPDVSSNGPNGKAVKSAHLNSNGDIKEVKGSLSCSALQGHVSSYKEIRRKENHIVKQAVLADLAYVELQLDNPLKALSVAKALLELRDCSKIYQFLGHMYAAEALCHLNRPKEAAEKLSVYITDEVIVNAPYGEEDIHLSKTDKNGGCEDGLENNGQTSSGNANLSAGNEEASLEFIFLRPEEARVALYVNLAVTFAIQGDREQGHQLITHALTIFPGHPKVVIGAAYVDLLLERTEEAVIKLKQLVMAPRV